MNTKAGIRVSKSKGMALMLVIPAVALAAVLSYAVLTNTGMQQQISANSELIAQADCMAESGITYALYNLQNPANAPTFAGSFWPGTTSPILIGTLPGSVNISLTSLGNNSYSIACTATAAGTHGGSISRTLTVTAQAVPTFGTPNQAAGFDGPLNPPAGATVTVTGDLRSTGAVQLNSGSSVSGNVFATSLTLAGGTDSAFVKVPSGSTAVAPTAVTDYRTYTMNGTTYSATLLTTDPTAGKVLGPTVSNPAGVYYAQNRSMNLNGITINGTLIIKNGNATVVGSTTNTITPVANFPGLVVDKQIVVSGNNRKLTVNGLVWSGTGLNGTGASNSGSVVTVNGSFLSPGTSGINNYTGALNLNYNANNVNVPNFSTQMQEPKSVKVLTWSQGS